MIMRRKKKTKAAASLKVAIVGLGTVGAGVFKILAEKKELIALRAGKAIEVVAVSARDRSKQRAVDADHVQWVDNPRDIPGMDRVDVVVELVGGEEGIAYALAKDTLSRGKAFVTANKALIARHGIELAKIAERHGAILAFEASVAGGIPVITSLKEGLSANEVNRVVGILNGTCNYILTAMQKDKRSFEEALKEAQQLGYAEADPAFDVDGIDTAHKLAILTSLAFGCPINIDTMHIEGIRGITLADIHYANELGYKIKLLGMTARKGKAIEQRTHPCLVPKESPIAQVDGVINAVVVECDSLGPLLLEGAGAGAGPTASAVVADIIDIAAGRRFLPFGVPLKELKALPFLEMDSHEGEYYIRITVEDKSGTLAAITTALSKQGIGVEQVLQPHTRDDTATIVITTHITNEKAMKRALLVIGKLAAVLEAPHVIRIEK